MPRVRHSVSTRAKQDVLLKRRSVLNEGAQIYFNPLKISVVIPPPGSSIGSLSIAD